MDSPTRGFMTVCGSIPPFALVALQAFAERHVCTVPPAFVVGSPTPLLSRWVLHNLKGLQARLHVFHRSDDDRAKHDHPWESLSITLRDGAVDVAHDGTRTVMEPGMMIYRSADFAHWIEVDDGALPMTLFLTGPKVREWGFHCPHGWRHWRQFTTPANGVDSGAVGAGCE